MAHARLLATTRVSRVLLRAVLLALWLFLAQQQWDLYRQETVSNIRKEEHMQFPSFTVCPRSPANKSMLRGRGPFPWSGFDAATDGPPDQWYSQLSMPLTAVIDDCQMRWGNCTPHLDATIDAPVLTESGTWHVHVTPQGLCYTFRHTAKRSENILQLRFGEFDRNFMIGRKGMYRVEVHGDLAPMYAQRVKQPTATPIIKINV
ncbi:uncharacterized protein LOC119113540 [Pollicipes pollicipes]|nr:uncharacterized protein LOC119113540 [Pollicipes pollicipes]